MEDKSWNFNFRPAENANYNKDEALDMVIHSARASVQCNSEVAAFNTCRSGPSGKIANPELCR
jgi:hypothetical protein